MLRPCTAAVSFARQPFGELVIAMGRADKEALTETDPGYSKVEPWLVTPDQYAGLMRPFERSPEVGLLVAVMADAVSVWLGHLRRPAAKGLREFEEAEQWFASDDSGPFSFLNICSVLDFEPAAVLRALWAIRDGEIWAVSRGPRQVVRRGCGRRHCVGPGPAAPVNQARQAQPVERGNVARGAEDARAAKAQSPSLSCSIVMDGTTASQTAPAPTDIARSA